jgi:hypothetical protein
MLFCLRAVFQVPVCERESKFSKERTNENEKGREMCRCEFEDMTGMTRDITELLILLCSVYTRRTLRIRSI